MSRQIKFRAWHKEKKVMFSAEEMGIDQMTLMTDGRGFVNVSGDDTRLSQIDNGRAMLPLQYTGLLDKQGKEIYEGDIVAFDREGKEYFRECYEIRYSPHRACWQLYYLGNCNHQYSPQWISSHFTQGEADSITVIGNIYENPELLKGEAK